MFKKIKPTTFDELTMNVFMLLSDFNPATFNFTTGIDGTKILASTTGGVTFADETEYIDLGEDIDNCPKNCMELKYKDDGNVHISGNLITLTPDIATMMVGAATTETITGTGLSGKKVTPKSAITTTDFTSDLWGVTDYGEGGLLAIHMKRVLNNSGISISTTDKEKSQIAFDFYCHKTIEDETDPPYELYFLSPSA